MIAQFLEYCFLKDYKKLSLRELKLNSEYKAISSAVGELLDDIVKFLLTSLKAIETLSTSPSAKSSEKLCL